MTEIKLHGILAKEFDPTMMVSFDGLITLIDAIDANRPGFLAKLNNLAEIGLDYCIVVDGEILKEKHQIDSSQPKTIDFVPIVCGHGVALAIAGVGLMVAGSTAFLGITALSIIGGVLLSTGLSMLLAPKQQFPDAVAAESSVTGLEKSFAFANRANIAAQGVSVPIGYGRMRTGTKVIQATVKTYPQNTTPTDAMLANPFALDRTISESESEIDN
jgi:predicted phage tail protein